MHRNETKNKVTIGFMVLCCLVTIPGIFSRQYFELFNSELPHEFWWQKVTMPFQHGASGKPLAILGHWLLNMIILFNCGKIVENLIGSTRLLILSVVAWFTFYITCQISGIWINGSSGIIWSYSPVLLVPLKWAKEDNRYNALANRCRGLLVIMWGVVTVAMGFIPFLFNPNHTMLHVFFFGNLFHFVAVMTGFGFYFLWHHSGKKPFG